MYATDKESYNCDHDGDVDGHSPSPKQPLLAKLNERKISKSVVLNPDLTFVSLVKALLGTGLLGLPMAFKNAGLYTGLFLLIIIICADIYCMRLIVHCAHYFAPRVPGGTGTLDYANVVKYAVMSSGPRWLRQHGRPVKLFVNGVIFVNGLGICCVYFVFMAENMQQVINTTAGTTLTKVQWMSVILPFVLLLSLIRHLRTLVPLSYVANAAYLVAFVITVQYLFYDHQPSSQLPAFAGFSTLPLYFGTVMFSFEGIVLVLPVENRCSDPKFFIAYNGILNTACLVTLTIYIAIGFFGYMKAGFDVQDSITLNLPTDIWYYQMTKLLFVFAVFVSYAMQFYPAIERIEKWITRKQFVGQHRKQMVACYTVRILLVLLTFTLAAIIPHLNLFMSLVGSVAGMLLAMIIPPIAYLCTCKASEQPMHRAEHVLQYVLIGCGLLGMVIGTTASIQGIVQAM